MHARFRPKPNQAFALTLITILVPLFLVACGSSSTTAAPPTATPMPTATPKDNKTIFATYTDPQGQFTIKYPSTWQTKVSTATIQSITVNITTFTPSQTKYKEAMVVAVGPQGLTLDGMGSVLQQIQATNYSQTSGPTAFTGKNKIQWQEVQGNVTGPAAGSQGGADGAYTANKALNYIVAAAGPDKAFLGDAKLFHTLLDSFNYGSASA